MNASHSQSDDRLAQLLAATERDAAPPDRAAMAALRERSAAAFAAEHAAASAEPVLSHQQRPTMFLSRALFALVASAAASIGMRSTIESADTNRPSTGSYILA